MAREAAEAVCGMVRYADGASLECGLFEVRTPVRFTRGRLCQVSCVVGAADERKAGGVAVGTLPDRGRRPDIWSTGSGITAAAATAASNQECSQQASARKTHPSHFFEHSAHPWKLPFDRRGLRRVRGVDMVRVTLPSATRHKAVSYVQCHAGGCGARHELVRRAGSRFPVLPWVAVKVDVVAAIDILGA